MHYPRMRRALQVWISRRCWAAVIRRGVGKVTQKQLQAESVLEMSFAEPTKKKRQSPIPDLWILGRGCRAVDLRTYEANQTLHCYVVTLQEKAVYGTAISTHAEWRYTAALLFFHSCAVHIPNSSGVFYHIIPPHPLG